MTDQSNEPYDEAEQAPSLAAFVRHGFDRAAADAVLAALVAEAKPKNLIERMWLRDIAVLSVRAAELRMVQVAVHKHLVAGTAKNQAGNIGDASAKLIEHGEAGSSRVLDCTAPLAGTALSSVTEGRLEQLVAQTYAEHLALIERLSNLEAGIRAERDRVVYQFDRRRSTELNDMIAFMEANAASYADE